MDSAELERRKRLMDELVDGIVESRRFFAARGIDVSDPVDREVIDGIKRLERKMGGRAHPTDAYQGAGFDA